MEDEHPGREAHKICGVCGDRALGYNFNAVSCESCKAFFRRNALKNKDFRCPFTENCDITPVTRRFCQKCRLDKCFAVGMRKEYIMSEEDKVLKRQKIEQNRAKKRPQSENPKVPKMKKEGIDDNNFDNDTTMSVTSVASVASVVGESYIWELDRKYTDLDASRHTMVDNMSPVTAASVPSPSSPSESANIIGSKTLEMLKDAKYNQSDINLEERLSNQARIDSISPSLMKFDNLSHNASTTENTLTTMKFNQNLSSFEATFHNSDCSQKYTMVDTSSCDSLRFDANKISEQPKISPIFTDCSTKAIPEPCSRLIAQVDSQMGIEESPICEKPNETGSKGSDSISKFMEDPSFLVKFLSNPNMVAKIFQDQGLITKILTDSDTINRLASDPQISQFFEENNVSSAKDKQDNGKVKAEFENTLANNGISDNMIRDMLEADQKEIENPILTNLITNRQCKTQQGEVEPNIGSNIWTKTMEDVTKDVLQDVQRIPVAANSIESILCEAIKLEFSAYSALGGNQNSRELNDAERAKLNELIVANKALLAPLDDDITNLVGDDCRFKGNSGQSDPVLLDVINLTAIAIRRLIKMSKKINAFKNMCQEDQLALLKGGCTEMMILRSAINYDPDREIWKIPHSQERMSNIKVDVLKEAKGNLYAEHARFVRTFDPRWRDENIILILSAIALFTPDRPRVVHSDVIKLEQNSYYYLLRRYLESVYPGCEAKSTFLKLIQKISELHRLNNEVVGVYLNVNPSSVEPLLIEIFDLKH